MRGLVERLYCERLGCERLFVRGLFVEGSVGLKRLGDEDLFVKNAPVSLGAIPYYYQP